MKFLKVLGILGGVMAWTAVSMYLGAVGTVAYLIAYPSACLTLGHM